MQSTHPNHRAVWLYDTRNIACKHFACDQAEIRLQSVNSERVCVRGACAFRHFVS